MHIFFCRLFVMISIRRNIWSASFVNQSDSHLTRFDAFVHFFFLYVNAINRFTSFDVCVIEINIPKTMDSTLNIWFIPKSKSSPAIYFDSVPWYTHTNKHTSHRTPHTAPEKKSEEVKTKHSSKIVFDLCVDFSSSHPRRLLLFYLYARWWIILILALFYIIDFDPHTLNATHSLQ